VLIVTPRAKTILQRFVNTLREKVIDLPLSYTTKGSLRMTRKQTIQTSTQLGSVRRRVAGIGEVAGIGPCWRLAYDRCDHVQYFAREGLEDFAEVVLTIQRHFSECLACRLATATRRNAAYRKLDPPPRTSARSRHGSEVVV
jgi:hypothetical protein